MVHHRHGGTWRGRQCAHRDQDVDAVGNLSAASNPLTVTLDTTTPTAHRPASLWRRPADSGVLGDGITNITQPTLTGTGTNGDTVALFDGTTLIGTGAVIAGIWSVRSDRTLGDGLHSITATTTDTAGNVSAVSTPLALTIDTSPPTPPQPALAAGSDSGVSATDGITNVIRPTVTGSAAAGDTMTLFDTDGAAVLGSTVVGVSGIWSITPTVALSEGAHSLTVTDRDLAGNTSTASAPLQVSIDTVAPNAQSIVSITASPSDAILGVGQTVTLTLTLDQPVIVTPNGNVSFLTLNDGGIAILTGIDPTNTVLTANYTVLGGQNTADLTVTGFNLNGAIGTDLAGNPADTIGFTINPAGVLQIKTTAPPAPPAPTLAAGSDSGVSDTDGVTNVVMPTITGIAATGDIMTLFDTDGATVLGTATAVGGTWSITPTVALSDGAHSFTVTDKDLAGNTSDTSAPLQVTIDTVGPSAASILSITTSPSTADLGVGSIVTLTITLNEPVIINTAGGVPTLTLNDGGTAVLTGINTAGTVITARYVVASGQNTADLAVMGVNLNGATITDVAGNQADTTGIVIDPAGTLQIITTAPPVPAAPILAPGSDSGISATDDITNVARPTLTGTAAAGDVITLFDGDDATLRQLGSATAAIDGTWSITPSVALSDGVHSLAVTATDVAGYTSNTSAPLLVTIDTIAPSAASILSITASPDTGILGVGDTVELTILLNERLVLDATADQVPSLALNDGGTAFFTGIDQTGTVITALHTVAAGQNTADLAVVGFNLNGATVTDVAGNPGNTTGTVINPAGILRVDTVIPTIAIATPIAGDNAVNRGEAAAGFAITGTTTDADAGQPVTVTIVNSANTVVDTFATTVTANGWSINVSALQAQALADGSYTVRANVSDTAGNQAPQAIQGLIVDQTAPTIAIAPIIGDNTVNLSEATAGFAIAGTTLGVEDGETATITLVNGASVAVESFNATVTGNAWSVAISADQARALADGSYTVQANVSDAAGNPAAQAVQALIVDETAPGVPSALVLAPASDSGVVGDNVTNVALPIVTGTAPAGSTVDLFDSTTLLGTGTADGTGAWSITATTALAPVGNILTAQAIDAAGNTSAPSDPLTITLDTTAPTVSLVTASPGAADLAAGQVVTLTLAMSQAVTVTTTGGTPSLTLNDGGTASHVSGKRDQRADVQLYRPGRAKHR